MHGQNHIKRVENYFWKISLTFNELKFEYVGYMNVHLHRLLKVCHVTMNRIACICSVKIRIKTSLVRCSLVYLHLNVRAKIFRNVGNERDVTSQGNLLLSKRLREAKTSNWQLHIIAASETTRHRWALHRRSTLSPNRGSETWNAVRQTEIRNWM
jgi:hypothetical protein